MRVAGRDGHAAEEAALAHNREREASERARYLAYYDIDLTDLSIYDLVVDSTTVVPAVLIDQIEAAARRAFHR